MHEHVALRMELRRLLDSLHRRNLRQHFLQQSALVKQKKSLTRMSLDQHLAELIAHALAGNLMNLGCEFSNRLECFGRNCVAETRSEAHRTQHPQFILSETPLRITDSSNDSRIEVFASANVIQNLVRDWIKQQSIDREIAAFDIFTRIFAEKNFIGMAPVAISDVTTKRGHLNHVRLRRAVTSYVSTFGLFCRDVACSVSGRCR